MQSAQANKESAEREPFAAWRFPTLMHKTAHYLRVTVDTFAYQALCGRMWWSRCGKKPDGSDFKRCPKCDAALEARRSKKNGQ